MSDIRLKLGRPRGRSMLGAVWTHQVSGLVVHLDGEGQQKKNLIWNHSFSATGCFCLAKVLVPKGQEQFTVQGALGQCRKNHVISCMLSRTPWFKWAMDLDLEVLSWKKWRLLPSAELCFSMPLLFGWIRTAFSVAQGNKISINSFFCAFSL